MILIGRGLDFANDLEINKEEHKESRAHRGRNSRHAHRARDGLSTESKLCSCQGVKTPQALEEEEKEDGRGLTNQTRGKRGAGCASRSGNSIAQSI